MKFKKNMVTTICEKYKLLTHNENITYDIERDNWLNSNL